MRLVASYARKWVTEDATRPHELPAGMQDFRIKWRNQSGEHTWSRIWNWRNAPEGYVSWIDPSPGVPMADNPLAEVGCPYTVRGFDYDYHELAENDCSWYNRAFANSWYNSPFPVRTWVRIPVGKPTLKARNLLGLP